MSNSNLKTFRWKGKNQFGDVLKGQLTAKSSAEISFILQQKGIVSFRIYPVFSLITWFGNSTHFLFQNSKSLRLELSFILQQLSMLLSAHVPLIQAFEVIESQQHNLSAILREILEDCRIHVQSGHTLAQAFSRHSQYFSDFFCKWIEAGEYSGTLDTLLEQWVIYEEKNQKIRQKVRKALTYPTFILSTALAVAALLMVSVLPVFEKIFHQMNAELPLLTQYVIFTSQLFNPWSMLFVGSLVLLLVMLWKNRLRIPKLLFFFDKQVIKLPFVGKILQEITYARFSRTLSILLCAGFPLSDALFWTAKVMNNCFLTYLVRQCQEAVILGTPLSKMMENFSYFSPLLKQMIIVGENSGILDKTLLHAAIFYEKKAAYSLEKITELIEPLLMLIVGLLAGIFIIAMYLPIFKLGALF